MTRIVRELPCVAILSASLCAGSARADEFQVGKAVSVEAIFARCTSASGVGLSLYLGKQVENLQVLLKARIAEQLKAIAAVAAQRSGPGLLGGAAASAAWKRDFSAAQDAWQAYNARECRNVFDYEWYGGSGAGSAELACEIRHLVVRVNELATP